VLTSSVGLWKGPLGVRNTQCPYLVQVNYKKVFQRRGGGAGKWVK
jgi:hypothetical protein